MWRLQLARGNSSLKQVTLYHPQLRLQLVTHCGLTNPKNKMFTYRTELFAFHQRNNAICTKIKKAISALPPQHPLNQYRISLNKKNRDQYQSNYCFGGQRTLQIAHHKKKPVLQPLVDIIDMVQSQLSHKIEDRLIVNYLKDVFSNTVPRFYRQRYFPHLTAPITSLQSLCISSLNKANIHYPLPPTLQSTVTNIILSNQLYHYKYNYLKIKKPTNT